KGVPGRGGAGAPGRNRSGAEAWGNGRGGGEGGGGGRRDAGLGGGEIRRGRTDTGAGAADGVGGIVEHGDHVLKENGLPGGLHLAGGGRVDRLLGVERDVGGAVGDVGAVVAQGVGEGLALVGEE